MKGIMYSACPTCGASNPEDSQFCGECGSRFAPAVIPQQALQPEGAAQEAPSALEQASSAPETVEPPAEEPPPPPPEEPPLAEDQQPLPLPAPGVEDHVYYERDDVRVTRGRAILGDQTYDMADVTSVSIESRPGSRMAGIATAMIGALVMFGFLFSREVLVIKLILALGGLVALVLGVVLTSLVKSESTVKIGTDSGEAGAYVSSDQEHAERIVRAMHRAIAARS